MRMPVVALLYLSLVGVPVGAQPDHLLAESGNRRYRLSETAPFVGPQTTLSMAGIWRRQFPYQSLSGTPQVLDDGRCLVVFVGDTAPPTPCRPPIDPPARILLLDPRGATVWQVERDWNSSYWPGEPYDGQNWLSRDGEHLWRVHAAAVTVVEVATGRSANARKLIGAEFNNPKASGEELLRMAFHLSVVPPTAFLHQSFTSKGRWLALGWMARGGDERARSALVEATRRGDRDAVEGLALSGEPLARPQVLKLMLKPADWGPGLRMLGPQAESVLLQALKEVALNNTAACYLAHSVGPSRNSEFWQPLVRLSHRSGPWREPAAKALTQLDLPDLNSRLTSLLLNPEVEHRAILARFQEVHYPEVNSALLKLLRAGNAEPGVLDALRYQTRVNFDLDADSWERWLQTARTHSAARKAQTLEELNEPTALLWTAQLGKLDLSKLERYPRLQAMWPLQAALSPDGIRLLAATEDGKGTLSWDAREGPSAWDPRTGRPLSVPGLAAESISLQAPGLTLVRGPIALDQQASSSWKVLSPSGQMTSLPGSYFGWMVPACGSQALLWGRRDAVYDARSGNVYPFNDTLLFSGALSPTRAELAVHDYSTQTLRLVDCRSRSDLFRLPLRNQELPDLKFSRDGNRLLLYLKDSWRVYDRSGRRLMSGGGKALGLSWTGDQVAAARENKFCLTSRQSKGSTASNLYCSVEGKVAFLPDASACILARCQGWHSMSLVYTADPSHPIRFWGPPFMLSLREDGRQFSAGWYSFPEKPGETWIWKLGAKAPPVPPDKQSLLCELWTGMHLQGGMAIPLNPEQYAIRVKRWGGNWY